MALHRTEQRVRRMSQKNRVPLPDRVAKAAESAAAVRHYVSAIDVLVGIGGLTLERWSAGARANRLPGGSRSGQSAAHLGSHGAVPILGDRERDCSQARRRVCRSYVPSPEAALQPKRRSCDRGVIPDTRRIATQSCSAQARGSGAVIKLGDVVMILDLHRQGLSISPIAHAVSRPSNRSEWDRGEGAGVARRLPAPSFSDGCAP
jgi:hypothetical protein